MAFNYQTASLKEICAHIAEDGVVDKAEADALRKRLFADGTIDREEADLLFEINDVTSANSGHDPSWQTLFVEALASHLLNDPQSPGDIDGDEAEWLLKRIEGDGKCDGNERALLVHLKKKAKSINSKLSQAMGRLGI